jgi:hypothetical protein
MTAKGRKLGMAFGKKYDYSYDEKKKHKMGKRINSLICADKKPKDRDKHGREKKNDPEPAPAGCPRPHNIQSDRDQKHQQYDYKRICHAPNLVMTVRLRQPAVYLSKE